MASDWYKNKAERTNDQVLKQHLLNYASAIDATKAAWDVVSAHADQPPEGGDTRKYQDEHNRLVRYAMECEVDQRCAYYALELYRAGKYKEE